jgi:hypothetical protein
MIARRLLDGRNSPAAARRRELRNIEAGPGVSL